MNTARIIILIRMVIFLVNVRIASIVEGIYHTLLPVVIVL